MTDRPFNRQIILHVHDDFNLPRSNTWEFIKSLLEISSKGILEPNKGIKIIKSESRYKTILKPDGKIIEILAQVRNKETSSQIIIGDFVLGYNNDLNSKEIAKIKNLMKKRIII